MSGIFGCIHLDGAPVDRPLLERMLVRLAHRGPDGNGLWFGGSAGLGHLALHTTPESIREHLPLSSADGSLHLTLDGRVDNRAPLTSALCDRGFAPRDDTDAELVLQAYRCWGEGCPGRIVGDFAFAIWDSATQSLLCARDVVGMRPFYYFLDDSNLIWSSEVRALFEHPGVTRTPNEQVIAELLTETLVSTAATALRDVMRLPAGHLLLVRAGKVLRRRYWDIDRGRVVRYKSDSEYAAHFHEIFGEAVRCRMRSNGPIAFELSGGLDSSSVVAMACAQHASRLETVQPLETLSLVFPGRACDERKYIEAVVERWNLKAHYLEPAVWDSGFYQAQARQDQDLPIMPNGCMMIPLRELQASRGMRVVLDGNGGDEWFSGDPHRLADLARSLRLVEFVRQAHADVDVETKDVRATTLLRKGLWPLLPLALRMGLRRLARRRSIPPFIGSKFAERLPTPRERAREIERNGFPTFAQSAMYRLVEGPLLQQSNEDVDRLNARWQVEARSPFCDRRLIEFAFALPENQRWRGGLTKFILREAMRDLLPPMILARRSKADFSYVVAETMRRSWGGLANRRLRSEALGWIRQGAIEERYTRMTNLYQAADEGYANHAWVLWRMFAVELWLEMCGAGPEEIA